LFTKDMNQSIQSHEDHLLKNGDKLDFFHASEVLKEIGFILQKTPQDAN